MSQFHNRLVRLTSQNRLIPKVSAPAGFFWNEIDKLDRAQYAVLKSGFDLLGVKWKTTIDDFTVGHYIVKPLVSDFSKLKVGEGVDTSSVDAWNRRVVVVLEPASKTTAKELLFVAGKKANDFRLVMSFRWIGHNFNQTA